MRLLIVNPNTTASMTASIGEAARLAASPGTEVTALNPTSGPPAIQGPEDGEAALPGLFDLIDSEFAKPDAYHAVIIACFDDTGLAELKTRSPVPVIGIGEAGFHMAMLVGHRFSVVTTLSVSVPVIEENIRAYGFGARCASVRASEIPVLDLEKDPEAAMAKIGLEIDQAIGTDGCDAIVLGCAGMADMAKTLGRRHGKPVIDGVASATVLAEAAAKAA
ncbi:MAG: aspartate/glutamate racemase family protein [Pseudomonadota bacterium]